GVAGIVLDVPGGELIAGDDRRAFGAMELGALGVPRPEGRSGLDYAGGAIGIFHNGVDHILRFDFVQRAQLPGAVEFADGAGETAQDVDLVDGLVDERASALGLPAAFEGARVVGRGAVPLDVAIGLQQFAEPAGGDGLRQEDRGIVEAVLADHAEPDIGAAGRL